MAWNGFHGLKDRYGDKLAAYTHEELKRSCLAYIEKACSEQSQFSGSNVRDFVLPEKTPDPKRQEARDVYPFLEYSLCNVLYYANAAAANRVSQVHFLASFPRKTWIAIRKYTRLIRCVATRPLPL